MTEPESTRRHLDSTGRRLVLAESLGVVCIVIGVAQIYDGWRAVGFFGAGLIWVCQLIDRRTAPLGRR